MAAVLASGAGSGRGWSLEADIYRTDARRQILNVTVRRIAGPIGWGPWRGCHTERPEGGGEGQLRLLAVVFRILIVAVGMGQASVLVKAQVRCRRIGIQLAVPAAARALASRSLSMLTWSLSIPVRTLRATASRSAMSGEASE